MPHILLAKPKETEPEVLTLCRRKLTSGVYTLAQMIDNPVIAIYTGCSFTLSHKVSIPILKFSCTRHLKHTLEINSSLIPSELVLIRIIHSAGYIFTYVSLKHRIHTYFINIA